ncbi:hypothetical protein B0O99DRAFT_670154 [Bisporella sp. PMI_857]|nr:hypothetical protein B0O99DRAFT_670154 [Bisporella sp. PMI_857]
MKPPTQAGARRAAKSNASNPRKDDITSAPAKDARDGTKRRKATRRTPEQRRQLRVHWEKGVRNPTAKQCKEIGAETELTSEEVYVIPANESFREARRLLNPITEARKLHYKGTRAEPFSVKPSSKARLKRDARRSKSAPKSADPVETGGDEDEPKDKSEDEPEDDDMEDFYDALGEVKQGHWTYQCLEIGCYCQGS